MLYKFLLELESALLTNLRVSRLIATALPVVVLLTIARHSLANGGPPVDVFLLIGATPVVLGEVGVDAEIPTSTPRWTFQAWLGGAGALAIIFEEVEPIAPELSMDTRFYFSKKRYEGGFMGFQFAGGYMFLEDLLVFSPGLKVGYKTSIIDRLKFEFYTTINASFYHDIGSDQTLFFGFYPLFTLGLRFTFEAYGPKLGVGSESRSSPPG